MAVWPVMVICQLALVAQGGGGGGRAAGGE